MLIYQKQSPFAKGLVIDICPPHMCKATRSPHTEVKTLKCEARHVEGTDYPLSSMRVDFPDC